MCNIPRPVRSPVPGNSLLWPETDVSQLAGQTVTNPNRSSELTSVPGNADAVRLISRCLGRSETSVRRVSACLPHRSVLRSYLWRCRYSAMKKQPECPPTEWNYRHCVGPGSHQTAWQLRRLVVASSAVGGKLHLPRIRTTMPVLLHFMNGLYSSQIQTI